METSKWFKVWALSSESACLGWTPNSLQRSVCTNWFFVCGLYSVTLVTVGPHSQEKSTPSGLESAPVFNVTATLLFLIESWSQQSFSPSFKEEELGSAMLENVFRITQLLDVKAEVELYLTSRLHCCVNLFISVSSFQLKGKLLGVEPRRCHFRCIS